MIGSVFEARDQMAALERRREEVAAQQAAAAVTPAAAPVMGGLAAAVAGAGYAPAAAFKDAQPDVVKRRFSAGERRGVAGDAEELREHRGGKRGKGKDRKSDRVGRDLHSDPVQTDARESARAGEDSRKAYQDRGATEGPGDFMYPGHLMPQSVDRDYLRQGHASQSPQAEPPRSFPLIDDHPQAEDFHRRAPRQTPVVHAPQGIPQPIRMSDAPMAAGIPTHIASSYSLGSPSDR